MDRRTFLVAAGALTAFPAEAATPPLPEMNQAIVNATKELFAQRRGGGYNLSYAYTRELAYGGDTIRPTPSLAQRKDPFQHATMCVAAAAEVIIYALNKMMPLYGGEIRTLDASTWQRGTILSLRPYLFMQVDTNDVFGYKPGDVPYSLVSGKKVFALSRGAAHAFSIFKIGRELPFEQLLPGDFINLNRANGTGHCVVFLGYIDAQNRFAETYSPHPLGFRYFSAQGPHVGGGFDFRDAYFNSASPHPAPTSGYKSDGTIHQQTSQVYLNSGRLSAPHDWKVAEALAAIRAKAAVRFAARPVRGASDDYYELQDQGQSFMQFDNSEV